MSICVLEAARGSAQMAMARAATAPHIAVELISAAEGPVAGQQVLGLKFTMEPGWHIYWQNPGDSGTPPDTQWRLPSGVSAAPIEWPLPERITETGAVYYGYHGQVVLPVMLTIASDTARRPLIVRAAVRWLVCSSVCVAGKADLELALPLDAVDRVHLGEWERLIAQSLRQVPRPAPPSWQTSGKVSGEVFVVDIITGQSEHSGTLYPLDVSQIDGGSSPVRESLPSGVRFTLRKSQQLVKDPATLRFVLALDGNRTGIVKVAMTR
jgi:thiol:disulfide interchange protein DsbD